MKYSSKVIIDLVVSGKTYQEVADILGCVKSTVSAHCRAKGIVSKKATVKLSSEKILEIRDLYLKVGLDKAALLANVSKFSVLKYSSDLMKKPNRLSAEKIRENGLRAIKNIRVRTKQRAVEYKGGKCEKCGYNKYQGALEFHHIDPAKKDFSVSQFTLTWDRIKEELDKCLMLCSNCHRETHHDLRQRNNTSVA